ncbi:MAG: hypothetical protein RLY78_2531 [Pseudomonadota bacterium]
MNDLTRFTRRQALHGAAAVITAATGTALAGAPGLVHAAGERPLLRAGDQKGGLRALLETAGALDGLDYDIAWTEFPAAAPLAEALNAEAVDLGPIGDAPLIFAQAQGVRIKAYGVNRSDPYGTAVLVRADSPIRQPADLRGRSVATNRGSIGHHVTLRTLAAAGLKPDDIDFRFLAPPDAKLALVAGSVDAWATWEPYTAVAETIDRLRVLRDGRGLSSGLSYLAATDRALRDKRPQLADFRARVQRAQAWSNQHIDRYAATLSRIVGIPEPAARLAYSRRRTTWIALDRSIVDEQQRTADFYLTSGLLPKRLEVAGGFITV